jgi:lsr operon transcriptional repressor
LTDEDGGLDRWRLEEPLLRVAWYYYMDELTQDEIARRVGMSRASVGRMLERARSLGLISISLNSRYLAAFALAHRLRDAFGLTDALVVPEDGTRVSTQEEVNARLGIGGAQMLGSMLGATSSLGVGWGDTVSRMLVQADLSAFGGVHLVTLAGGVAGYLPALTYSREGGPALAASVIPSPIVASTPELAAALRSEPIISAVIAEARRVTHAVVGVGTATADSTLVKLGYLTAEDARVLVDRGVVGDILGQFFDIHGQVLDLPVHARRIGIDLSDLANIDTVIGIAGGDAKVEAILGALRGGYLDVLVTNELVAMRLLDLAGPRE